MLVVGVDEAGRGCLSGPVFAAAVLLPTSLDMPKGVVIRDSKKMSTAQRDRSRVFIEENAIAWGVGYADVECIDNINILRATQKAMHHALDSLMGHISEPDISNVHLYVDGDRFRDYKCPHTSGIVPHTCVVRGDATELSIAAASILAKTHRDEYVLQKMHPLHPEYGWDKNKGYGTARHIEAIRVHGTREGMHRLSFAPCRS
jgi:ribonuclease HII